MALRGELLPEKIDFEHDLDSKRKRTPEVLVGLEPRERERE